MSVELVNGFMHVLSLFGAEYTYVDLAPSMHHYTGKVPMLYTMKINLHATSHVLESWELSYYMPRLLIILRTCCSQAWKDVSECTINKVTIVYATQNMVILS